MKGASSVANAETADRAAGTWPTNECLGVRLEGTLKYEFGDVQKGC